MRVLFFVLLIANLVLLAIAQLNISNSPVQAREELNPEKLRLLAPDNDSPAQSSSTDQ